jgi:NAD(P)-dependent dehydrogenase (short-subunit alcohol dehydrogenase family)
MKDVVVVGGGSRIGRSHLAALAAALATVGANVSVDALVALEQRKAVERAQIITDEDRERMRAAEEKRQRRAAKRLLVTWRAR